MIPILSGVCPGRLNDLPSSCPSLKVSSSCRKMSKTSVKSLFWKPYTGAKRFWTSWTLLPMQTGVLRPSNWGAGAQRVFETGYRSQRFDGSDPGCGVRTSSLTCFKTCAPVR